MAPDWRDDMNRSFPGYPEARSPPFLGRVKKTSAQCWDENAPLIFVRIVDFCPCNRPPEQGGHNQVRRAAQIQAAR